MAEIGQTELAATQEDIISALVQRELLETARLPGTVMDMSSMVGKGMASVSFPRFDSFSSEDKAENTDLTAAEITASVDQLLLDKHKAIYAKLEDKPDLQNVTDMDAQIISRMGRRLALDVDEAIYAQLALASAAAPDHRIAYANATDLGKADILEARKLLKTQNAPEDGRWWLAISPANEKAILSIADFVDASQYGSSMPVQNGEIGKIYGFRVVVSNSVADAGSIAYHSEAVAYAFQRAITFEKDRDLKSVSTEYLGNAIFGTKVLQGGKLNVLLGSAT